MKRNVVGAKKETEMAKVETGTETLLVRLAAFDFSVLHNELSAKQTGQVG